MENFTNLKKLSLNLLANSVTEIAGFPSLLTGWIGTSSRYIAGVAAVVVPTVIVACWYHKQQHPSTNIESAPSVVNITFDASIEGDHCDVFCVIALEDRDLTEVKDFVGKLDCICKKLNMTFSTEDEALPGTSPIVTFEETAIKRSTYVFLLLTENFEKSPWAGHQAQEFLLATFSNPKKMGCLIPVLVQDIQYRPACTSSIKPLCVCNGGDYAAKLEQLLKKRQHFKHERIHGEQNGLRLKTEAAPFTLGYTTPTTTEKGNPQDHPESSYYGRDSQQSVVPNHK